MSLETLDSTLWSFPTALAYVKEVAVAERAQTWWKHFLGKEAPFDIDASQLPQSMVSTAERKAKDELLIALRDGYVRATGRRSTTPALFSASTDGRWRLHSTDPALVTTTEWRDGKFDFLRFALTSSSWEYIDIRMPCFMVKAIWPDVVHETATPAGNTPEALYTTPYLDLMQAAIADFGITAARQEKKDCLTDWFLEHQIDGEPVSRNLADAMATLIRLPSAQRGGSKRMAGPALRRTG